MGISQLASGLSLARYTIEDEFRRAPKDADEDARYIVSTHGYTYEGLGYAGTDSGRDMIVFLKGGVATGQKDYDDALRECRRLGCEIQTGRWIPQYQGRRFDFVLGKPYSEGNLLTVGEENGIAYPIIIASYDRNGNMVAVPFNLRPENYDAAEKVAESLGIVPVYRPLDDAGSSPVAGTKVPDFMKEFGKYF